MKPEIARGANDPLDIETHKIGEWSADDLKFHPKVHERLLEILKTYSAKLKTCKPEELADCQAHVKVCELVLTIPEILGREHKREKGDK